MIEIYQDISDELKQQAEIIFNLAQQQTNPTIAAEILNSYLNTRFNPREQEFVEFYFNLRMEQLLYERAIDIWEGRTR